MEEKKNAGNHYVPLSQQPFLCYQRSLSPARWHGKHTYLSIRITSVNSTNQASDVCRRTTSGSDNNNPHSNVNNNMTTSNNLLHVFDFKQYEVDKKYSPQCKRETLS